MQRINAKSCGSGSCGCLATAGAVAYGDAAEDWNSIVALHEKAIKKRIGEIEEERRNDKLGGGKRDAPAGVVAVVPTEKYAFQLEKGKSSVAENILEVLKCGAMSAAEIGATIGMKSRAEGHPHKWAIVPTMRKLLSLLNRIARDPNFVPTPEPESTKKNALAGRKKKAA